MQASEVSPPTFGLWIKAARVKAGVRQRDLGPKVGLNEFNYADFEDGRRVIKKEEVVVVLAEELGLDVDEALLRAGLIPRWIKAWVAEDCNDFLSRVRLSYGDTDGTLKLAVLRSLGGE